MSNTRDILLFSLLSFLNFSPSSHAQQTTRSETAWDHNTQQYVLIDVPVDCKITGTPTVDSHGDVLANGTAYNYSMLSVSSCSTTDVPSDTNDESSDTTLSLPANHHLSSPAEKVDGLLYPPTHRLHHEDAATLVRLAAKHRQPGLPLLYLALLSVHSEFSPDEAMILATLLIENPKMANFEIPPLLPRQNNYLSVRSTYETTLKEHPEASALASRVHADFQEVLEKTNLTANEAGELVLGAIQGGYPIATIIRKYKNLAQRPFVAPK